MKMHENRGLSPILRRDILDRDNYACQKCRFEDKTAKTLEVHHIIPQFLGGDDKIDNLITLCSDCHHFAPNTKKDFEEYVGDECNGTMTIFLKAWNKCRKEHPELFENTTT